MVGADLDRRRAGGCEIMGAKLWQSLIQRLRPLICPFEPLISALPDDGRVLDVGCGTGALILAATVAGKVREALGVDISGGALVQARLAASERLDCSSRLVFQQCESPNEIEGQWETVIMVDVLHHVPISEQESFWKAAALRVSSGGSLIYKDMCHRPFWRVGMNRLHDLVVAKQWIQEVPLETVKKWASESGFKVVQEKRYTRLWYGHELLILEKCA